MAPSSTKTYARKTITDHAGTPGPLYWDFRCTTCSRNIREHAGFFKRLKTKLLKEPLVGPFVDGEL